MPKNKKNKDSHFKGDPCLKMWLKQYPGDSKKAICVLCNKKTTDIANMGVSALLTHKTKNESHKLKKASLESSSCLYFTQNIQMSPH